MAHCTVGGASANGTQGSNQPSRPQCRSQKWPFTILSRKRGVPYQWFSQTKMRGRPAFIDSKKSLLPVGESKTSPYGPWYDARKLFCCYWRLRRDAQQNLPVFCLANKQSTGNRGTRSSEQIGREEDALQYESSSKNSLLSLFLSINMCFLAKSTGGKGVWNGT